jgi:hypothetical protein
MKPLRGSQIDVGDSVYDEGTERFHLVIARHSEQGSGPTPSRTWHPLARLDELQVREILLARKTGSSIRSLAKQYGVSYENVRCIVNRVTWKHVTLPQE